MATPSAPKNVSQPAQRQREHLVRLLYEEGNSELHGHRKAEHDEYPAERVS
jgi:hypothetical protein